MENVKLTKDLIKNLVEEINNSFFQGKLEINFEIRILNTTRSLGNISYKKPGFLDIKKEITINYLGISKNFDFSIQELKNVIAHELIHVYEIQVLKQVPAHGFSFNKKMKEINEENKSYNVEIRTGKTPNKKKTSITKDGKTPIIIIDRLFLVPTAKLLKEVSQRDDLRIVLVDAEKASIFSSNFYFYGFNYESENSAKKMLRLFLKEDVPKSIFPCIFTVNFDMNTRGHHFKLIKKEDILELESKILKLKSFLKTTQ